MGPDPLGMPRSSLYVAITSHGFGHAVRACSVVAAMQQQDPEVYPILATTVPRWLLAAYLPGAFHQRERALDVGAVQSDSMTLDQGATLAQWQQLEREWAAIVAEEAAFAREQGASLVLGDIPPLAVPIAEAAGVPAWLMSNFGWDYIYRPWGGEFARVADTIAACYSRSDRLFRLPMHEPMAAFPAVTDVGLVGGSPRFEANRVRADLGIETPPERTVLLTFGGLGLQQLPYANLRRFPDWQFITFDREAPPLPNLMPVTDAPYRPVDLMPLCGRVISKPGYSTFAEALRVGVPIASLTREDFAEGPLLVEGLRDYAWHQILTPTEFLQGDWSFLHDSPQPPRRAHALATDGTETIAQAAIAHCRAAA